MMKINRNIQSEILMTTMEELVPKDSLFRKVDKYIDFTFIYDKVKDLYCADNGKYGYDPVVLFKLVFIQALDGLKSMRQTCKKVNKHFKTQYSTLESTVVQYNSWYLLAVPATSPLLLCLLLDTQKTKIMASGPIISWKIDGETVSDFIFWGSKITADCDCSHEIKRHLVLGRKAMTNLAAAAATSLQSCPTLCDPIDGSPPG